MTLGGLTWDSSGSKYYYTGIDAVALYVWNDKINPDGTTTNPKGWYGKPIAWNGVTAVNESPSGAESNKFYADNIEYLNLLSKEEFGCTLECYQVPEEFGPCDGIMLSNNSKVKVRCQPRKPFGLVYRVQKGSDTKAAGEEGYVYHIIYGCKASPSSRDFATVNDSPEAQTFSYEISTTSLSDGTLINEILDNAGNPVKELVHMEIEVSDQAQLDKLNALLYGSSTKMPTPNDIVDEFAA